MTRAIIENKKIVGFEKIVEPFEKATAEEYARRQNKMKEKKYEFPYKVVNR